MGLVFKENPAKTVERIVKLGTIVEEVIDVRTLGEFWKFVFAAVIEKVALMKQQGRDHGFPISRDLSTPENLRVSDRIRAVAPVIYDCQTCGDSTHKFHEQCSTCGSEDLVERD